MSYFCANAISINKKELTCKVKGGDNNVMPRSNYWSRYFPISEVIKEIFGGNIQFKTRSDKNIAIENLAYKYDKLMKELTGLSAYDASDLPKTPKETLATYEATPETHWNYKNIVKIIEVLKDEKMLDGVAKLKEEFVQEVINMKLDKKKFVIFNKEHNAYVSKSTKRSLHMSAFDNFAKKFTLLKAKDILKSYDKNAYAILPVKIREI